MLKSFLITKELSRLPDTFNLLKTLSLYGIKLPLPLSFLL